MAARPAALLQPPPQPAEVAATTSEGQGTRSPVSATSANTTTTITYVPLTTGDEVRLNANRPRHSSLSSKRTSRVFETNELTAPMDEGLQDGPVFRATIEELERGALSLRVKLKQIIRAASVYIEQDKLGDVAAQDLVESLRGLETMSPAVQYLDHVFSKLTEAKNAFHNQLQSLLLEPLDKMYENELQSMETQKKAFDQHSHEYNGHLEKYLSTMRDAKESKLRKTDEKFLQRRAAYNLVRFDYLSSLEQLHFQKEQQVMYHVSSFAEKHAIYRLKCARLIEAHKPELDELNATVSASFAEISNWLKGRQEMRKIIEMSSHAAADKMINMTAQAHRGSMSKFRGIRDLVLVDNTADVSDNKQGFLFTKHNSWREWRKVWIVIDDGMFYEYTNWKPDSKIKGGTTLDLRTTMVKEALKSERRFCLELISPQTKRIYQALSQEDMNLWIQVIQKAIKLALNKRMSFQTLPSSSTPHDENRVRRELLKDPSNGVCADCGSKDPEWGSINLGVLVCIGCSGIHRSLGTHISKMRSITLDTVSWTPELLAVFAGLGNAASNAILEYQHGIVEKPQPSTTREDKAKYIQAKYVAHALVEPRDESISSLKVLIRAATRDDLVGALRSIVWGADVNGLYDNDDEIATSDDKSGSESESDDPPPTQSCRISVVSTASNASSSSTSNNSSVGGSDQGARTLSASAPVTPSRLIIGQPEIDKWFSESPITPTMPRATGTSTISSSCNGLGALHIAVRDGYAAMAEFLILNGADANLPDRRGNTPLHHATIRGDDAAVAYLIKHEARLDVRNVAGQRPSDIAIEAGYQRLLTLLLSAHSAPGAAQNI